MSAPLSDDDWRAIIQRVIDHGPVAGPGMCVHCHEMIGDAGEACTDNIHGDPHEEADDGDVAAYDRARLVDEVERLRSALAHEIDACQRAIWDANDADEELRRAVLVGNAGK
jgi:hypothetical protein